MQKKYSLNQYIIGSLALFLAAGAQAGSLVSMSLDQAIKQGATPSYQENQSAPAYYSWQNADKTCVWSHGQALCATNGNPVVTLWQKLQYKAAVYDSAVFTPSHLDDNQLVVLSAAATSAAMVKWAPANMAGFYKNTAGWQPMTKPGGLFVASVAQMQTACHIAYTETKTWFGFDRQQFDLKMAELLGMPPGEDYSSYVFFPMQVKLVDTNPVIPDVSDNTTIKDNGLFRPCSDPDVAKQDCAMPSTANSPQRSAGYTTWFFSQLTGSHAITANSAGYPWTGLGYTYQWDQVYNAPSNPKAIVGVSEFVIPQNGQIQVTLNQQNQIVTYTPAEFCG